MTPPKTYPCKVCGIARVHKHDTACADCFANMLGWREPGL